MVLFFRILAAVLLGAAAVLLWQRQQEYAFAAAVLSACAFFLALRFELKARVSERDAAKNVDEDLPEQDD